MLTSKFKNPLQIHNKDHLSMLPEDCVREIFQHLNHDHLDVLATVSQHMLFLSAISRSIVKKVAAHELKVFKTIDGERYVDLVRQSPLLNKCLMHDTNGNVRTIEYAECKPYDRWVQMVDFKTSNADLSFIIKQAAFMMSKYAIDEVTFTSVLIDENFIGAFEQVWRERCMRKLEFHNSSLVDPKHAGVGKRLLKLLLSAKPSELRLDARGVIKEIDEMFLTEYARAVRSPRLFAGSTTKKPFTVSEQFANSFATFDSLVMDRLRVGAEWIVPAILNRLRRKRYGNIACAITRKIDRSEIIEQLEQDIEYINVEGRIVLRLRGTDYYADIKTTDAKPCRLNVSFTRRVEREAAVGANF